MTSTLHIPWVRVSAWCLLGLQGAFGRGIVRTKGPKVSWMPVPQHQRLHGVPLKIAKRALRAKYFWQNPIPKILAPVNLKINPIFQKKRSDGRLDRQLTSETPIASGLATRIRDGKPGSASAHRKVPGNG